MTHTSGFEDPDSYRFEQADPRWIPFLDEHGFVVVKGVVGDCGPHVAGLWGIVEELSGGKIRRDEPRSLGDDGRWPYMLHGGMIQYLGHTPLQWALRELCAPVFAALHGCDVEELASSFDGLCLMSGRRRYEPRSPTSFLHTDQGPRRPDRWSIQGLVNLVESDEASGGLVVIPGTHKLHREYFRSRGIAPGGDWYKFSEEQKRDPIFARHLKVCAGPGDFLMFDSRTFHCNTVPGKPVDRLCAYVCMLPKTHVPAHVRRMRREALDGRRCSSHHPGDGFRVFPEFPRFASAAQRAALAAPVRRLQEPPLTPLQMSLACVA